MTNFKTNRICAGEYTVTDGNRVVKISQITFWDGPGWIAAAEWDRDLHTDPMRTKRDAVHNAEDMLEEAMLEEA